MQAESDRCPQCGAALRPEATASGQCPACLLKLALEPAAAAGAVTSAVTQTAGVGGTPHLRFAPSRPVPEVGALFGPYRLHRILGQGGFGLVFEAEHRETHRRVALKVVTSVRAASRADVERFEREGRLAASVNHPRCVFVFGAEEIDGYPTIAMELMPGGTLQDTIDRRGPSGWREAVDAVLDVIEGLEAAQAAGVVHRDIKPSNCFLDEQGRVKIGDFGISKTLDEAVALTQSGTFVGTPVYAAPEQARGGEVDFRTDMYAVGATLYALLTGKPPFAGTGSAEVLARVMTEAPAALSAHSVQVPHGLESVVLRLLAKAPAKRFSSYKALRTALLPFSSSGALSPARLGTRLLAFYFLDWTVFLPVLARPLIFPFAIRSESVVTQTFLTLAAVWLYFTLTEWWFGRSLGKFMTGLRVTAADGAPITLGQAALRNAALVALVGGAAITPSLGVPWLALGFWGVLLITMRDRNGYAGPHELMSGTRVVRASLRERPRAKIPSVIPSAGHLVAERQNPNDAATGIGPYRPIHTVWQTDDEAFVIAVDDVLKRRVWIHRFGDRARVPEPSVLAVTRPGRLRWLAGHRVAGAGWDAYEAPSGASLHAWIVRRRRVSGRERRRLLIGLLEELHALETNGHATVDLSPFHAWVQADGRITLLDFPAVLPEGRSVDTYTVSLAQWPAFVRQVAVFMRTGTLVPIAGLDDEPAFLSLRRSARGVDMETRDLLRHSSTTAELLTELRAHVDAPRVVDLRRVAVVTIA